MVSLQVFFFLIGSFNGAGFSSRNISVPFSVVTQSILGHLEVVLAEMQKDDEKFLFH